MPVKFVLFALILILGFGFIFSTKTQVGDKSQTPEIFSTPVPQQSDVISPDGTMKLIMTKKQEDNGIFYSFSVSDKSNKKTEVFSKVAALGEIMALHHNSWSPNNKYFMIEDKQGSFTDYLVFKANGESFPTGEKYLNATVLFNGKVKNYNLKSMTGWDDPVLISVRTVNGPHFWFDLTTQSFIQLAR